jgi:hypothetical protein
MKKNAANSNKPILDDSERFSLPVGQSSAEMLTSKAYYEARTLKLLEQFSPQKPLQAASRLNNNYNSNTNTNASCSTADFAIPSETSEPHISIINDYPNAKGRNDNNALHTNDPTQLSRLFSTVFAFVATGLFLSLDQKRRVRINSISFCLFVFGCCRRRRRRRRRRSCCF